MQMQIVTSYTRAACRRVFARVVTRFTLYVNRDTHTDYSVRRKKTRVYFVLGQLWLMLISINVSNL